MNIIETPIERLQRETYEKIARLAYSRTAEEIGPFVRNLLKRWRDTLPMDREREIIAFCKNPRTYFPEELKEAVEKGDSLVRERASDLREIISLINWLRTEIVQANAPPVVRTIDVLERGKLFVEELRRDSLQLIIHISGHSESNCSEFITRFLGIADSLKRKQACLNFCPPERRVPNAMEMKMFLNRDRDAPIVTGRHGEPLPIAPAPIPVKVLGFQPEEAKAGMVFEILNNLRSEIGRQQEAVSQRQRQTQLARARLAQIEGEAA